MTFDSLSGSVGRVLTFSSCFFRFSSLLPGFPLWKEGYAHARSQSTADYGMGMVGRKMDGIRAWKVFGEQGDPWDALDLSFLRSPR